MFHRRRNHIGYVKSLQRDRDLHDLIKLWVLRILIPLEGHHEFYGTQGPALACPELCRFLGLDKDCDESKKILALLLKMHREMEHTCSQVKLPRKLAENIARLANIVGFTDIDSRILAFVVCLHAENVLEEATGLLGELSSANVHDILATLLELPSAEIRGALSYKGLLVGSGLIGVSREKQEMQRKLTLLSDSFAETIMELDDEPLNLLRDSVILSKPPLLALNDFEHLSAMHAVLRPYLRHSLATKKPGVNIFLYGPPGTGKTELSRIMAQELGCTLFEVASESEEGEPANSEERLRAFRIAQYFFARSEAILLFDEVEDIFGNGNIFFDSRKAAQSRKAWINRGLEENAVPTFWLANSVCDLDPAFVRRFDMVIEMPIPPQRQRERIIRKSCGDMLPDESVHTLAENSDLAPAIISRAVSVVQSVRDAIGEQNIPKTVESLINNTLEAQGHRSLKRNASGRLPEYYNPAFIHTDVDLSKIKDGLMGTKSGRLCLYGPPGTGKTAFARWLSEKLDMQLCMRRASDLLSMYVSGTERNIARAFREAENDNALLLIDEVDSFLQDRRQAHHSWEVTAVNEMLTQMESFPGIFIASTNLMDNIDQAALRRFDLKLRFGYLRPNQAWELFVRHCASLSLSAPEEALRQAITRIAVLTPGDFAAVARQHHFRPVTNPAALLAALEQECRLKEDGRAKVFGF